jgi:hypothetical protein
MSSYFDIQIQLKCDLYYHTLTGTIPRLGVCVIVSNRCVDGNGFCSPIVMLIVLIGINIMTVFLHYNYDIHIIWT